MRFFLNLSVGMKLALSALLAMLLLGGQALRTQARMGEVMARDAEQRAASEASGALHAALTGALQAELLGLGAATAQTPEAAAAAAAA
ncbi:methyl-accepting chemotaxis protein, partial [Pseudoroseomonas wenyumeiae]